MKARFKEVGNMTNIVIVVKDGMVQEVFCRNKNIEVELLDLDEQNIEDLREKEKRYEEIQKAKSYKDIL